MGHEYDLGDEQYTYSSGNTDKQYADRAKIWDLFFDLAPASVHDTISVQIQCDSLSIGTSTLNLKAYVAEADYSPEIDRTGATMLAQSRLKVKKKIENTIFKRNC